VTLISLRDCSDSAIGDHNRLIQFAVVEKFNVELVSRLDPVVFLRGHHSVRLRLISGERIVHRRGTGSQRTKKGSGSIASFPLL
jgi:hypothetical protein